MDLLNGLNHLSMETSDETQMEVDEEEIGNLSDVSMKDYPLSEIGDVSNQEDVVDHTSEPEELEQSFQSDAKALVQAIFKPESQGFKLATQSATTGNDLLKSNDEKFIVHNHYYNNIFTYPQDSNIGRLEAHKDMIDPDQENQFNNDQNKPSLHSVTPDQTFMILNLIKQTLNYSIGLFFVGLLFKNLKSDVLNEYNKLEHIKNLKIDQCKREYFINKCDEYGQLPALKDLCLEWSLCFSDEFHPDDTTFYTELVFKVIGSLINGFLEKFGNLNKIFLVTLLLVWYVGNFICGYYKGNSSSTKQYPNNDLMILKKDE